MLSVAPFKAATAPLRQGAGARPRPAARRAVVPPRALLNFFAPPAAAKAGRAQEIVADLLELTAGTNGGRDASPALRQEVEALVEELEGYCPRSPVRSPLLFGDFEVLYVSTPQNVGLDTFVGRTVFPGQRRVQSLAPPNAFVTEISYKTLGFLPGAKRYEGTFEPLDARTIQIALPELDAKSKGAPPRFVAQIAYLDERIRVVRGVPQEGIQEERFYVMKRIAAEDAKEEAPAPRRAGTRSLKPPAARRAAERGVPVAEEEGDSGKRSGTFGFPLGGRKKESLATKAERAYYAKRGGSGSAGGSVPASGSVRRGTLAASGSVRRGTVAAVAGGTTVRKSREDLAAARKAAEEERRAAAEAAVKARREAEEERRRAREKAEAERRAAAEAAVAERARQAQAAAAAAERIAKIKAASKEQVTALTNEATEAAAEARDTAAAAAAAQKAASALLRKAQQARGLIDQAAATTAAALEQLGAAKAQEAAAAAEFKAAADEVRQLEAAAARRK
eukprot:scaffold5.g984.t1